MPAPDCPSTSIVASCSCMRFMFSCISWACFIRPAKPPFIMGFLPLLSGFDARRQHPRIEVFDQIAYKRIAVDRRRRGILALLIFPILDLRQRIAVDWADVDFQPHFRSEMLLERRLEPILIRTIVQMTLSVRNAQLDASVVPRYQFAVMCKHAFH